MPSEKKVKYVANLVELVRESPHFTLVDFNDATHQGLEELRRELQALAKDKKKGETLRVVKNSLLRVALQKLRNTPGEYKKADLDRLASDEMLRGKTALLMLSEDFVPALQAFHKFTQGFEDAAFKIGIIDKRLYERDELARIAQLPSREVLMGQIAVSIRSPQTRVIYAAKFGISKLVNVLKQAGEKGD